MGRMKEWFSSSVVLVTQSCLTLCVPVDCSLPGSSVHGILQEEYWRGLPFPSPGDLPDPGIEPESPALWASLVAQLVKNPPAMQETQFDSWVEKIHWRRDRLPTPVFLGFASGSTGRESACNVGDQGSIPGLGRCPGEGKGYPLQYSGLENSMDCIVHGVAKSWMRLSLSWLLSLLNTMLPLSHPNPRKPKASSCFHCSLN